MKRRFFLAGLWLILGASLVFAAGGQASGTASSAQKTTITINIQAGTAAEAGWGAVAAAYMKKNPNVNVVVDLKPSEGYGDWVQNVFGTSNPTADIVAVNEAGAASVGKVINFLEYIDQKSPYSNKPWREQFNYDMQVIDIGRSELTSLSFESVQVLWEYNKDIFAKVGVQPPKTWNELITVCEKLLAAGYQPISIPGDFTSFWSGTMGWLAQIYYDQTSRSTINLIRAQRGDYRYDPDVDGVWKYDITDPFNDDTWRVNINPVRGFKALVEGQIVPDSQGMRTIWENFAKVFPKYAGGDNFFGTQDALPLFYQGKAAMMINGAWGLMQFKNDMAKLASGEEILSNEKAISGVQKFELGTFNMPSIEGPGIEAPVRTIEVASGFLGAVKKEKAHDDQVVDFLMFYSSQEGMSEFLKAALPAGFNPAGPSLVYGVELPPDVMSMFDNLSFIGNAQKGFVNFLARGVAGNGRDIQESYRLFYDYSYNYLSGRISVDQWLTSHKANVQQYLDQALSLSGISRNDLNNPQNAPTGQ